MPPNKECSVIIDGLYHEAPLSTVVNVCGACTTKDDCGDYQWAQTKLVPVEQSEEKDFIDELIEAGYEFDKYEGPSWKPEDRNII